jgi:hypothetical protein
MAHKNLDTREFPRSAAEMQISHGWGIFTTANFPSGGRSPGIFTNFLRCVSSIEDTV